MSCWRTTCPSPLGKLTLASDGTCLTGLWLEGQRYFDAALEANSQPREDLAVFCAARAWLDRYFAGQQPAICQLPLAPQGSAFRQTVWRLLCQIPTERSPPMAPLQSKRRKSWGGQRDVPRQWAARWDTTPSPSSSPATG